MGEPLALGATILGTHQLVAHIGEVYTYVGLVGTGKDINRLKCLAQDPHYGHRHTHLGYI